MGGVGDTSRVDKLSVAGSLACPGLGNEGG